jgi:hypothetical protein
VLVVVAIMITLMAAAPATILLLIGSQMQHDSMKKDDTIPAIDDPVKAASHTVAPPLPYHSTITQRHLIISCFPLPSPYSFPHVFVQITAMLNKGSVAQREANFRARAARAVTVLEVSCDGWRDAAIYGLLCVQVLGIKVDPLLAQEAGSGFEELKMKADLLMSMGELLPLLLKESRNCNSIPQIPER